MDEVHDEVSDFLYGPEDQNDILMEQIPSYLQYNPQPEDPSLLAGIIYLDEAEQYNYFYWLSQNDPQWEVCFDQIASNAIRVNVTILADW